MSKSIGLTEYFPKKIPITTIPVKGHLFILCVACKLVGKNIKDYEAKAEYLIFFYVVWVFHILQNHHLLCHQNGYHIPNRFSQIRMMLFWRGNIQEIVSRILNIIGRNIVEGFVSATFR